VICSALGAVLEWFGKHWLEVFTLFAELLVAYVIFLEVEHSRDSSFLQKTTSEESDEERRAIYKEFFSNKETKEERVDALLKKLMTEGAESDKLRRQCHNQLAMFHEMGFQVDRLRWIRWVWSKKRDRYVSVLPHAPVFFGLSLDRILKNAGS
jgi:hypothetical protein